MNKWLTAWTVAALTSCLLTGNATAAPVWTPPSTITSIETVGTDSGFIVYFSTSLPGPCSAAGSNALFIYPNQNGVTTDGVKMLLSTALLAFTTGKQVTVAYDNSTANCWGAYIKISQ